MESGRKKDFESFFEFSKRKKKESDPFKCSQRLKNGEFDQ